MAAFTTPKISIVMPTFNRCGMINAAIASVLSQSFQDWELIIIDDASTDETWQLLGQLSGRDPRIRPVRNERNNYPDISKNLNKGIEIAQSPYIARLDDDDFWIDSDKLKKQFDFLEKNSDYSVIGGGVIVVDPNGRELFRYFKNEKDEDIRKKALFSNPFSHTTVMFRKNQAISVGGYSNWIYAEDWDLWLKLGKLGKFYNFQDYFTKYTLTGANKSFVYQRPQAKMILKIISSHKSDYPNFWIAYIFNFAELLYSYLPLSLRKALHPLFSYFKRRFF